MIRIPLLHTALLLALAVPAAAQMQVFGGDSPRMSSMKIFWDQGPLGMLCVQYGQPEWNASYDGMLAQLEGKQLRLGKDFWTTLNTTVPLTIGGTKVPAGSYYLGLKCDQDRNFHLLVLRAEAADAAGWTPFMADQWQAHHACPMTMDKLDDSVQKLTIAFTGGEEDPTEMRLEVSWGTHRLDAPVKAHLGEQEEAVEEVVEEPVREEKDGD